ncbi:MAG: hypothetical protein PHV73_01420 [Eubacteriales bacterium]|nr:hypothetical protein [Eubacteriales bacterium]
MNIKAKVVGLLIIALLLLYGCDAQQNDSPFTISVLPQELKGFSIPGQSIHYLVTVEEESSKTPVTISASSSDAAISVFKEQVNKGQVAEVVVVPKDDSAGKTVEVIIQGERGSVIDSKTMTFEVIEGTDDRKERAEELLQPFITYLADSYPDFNITEDTEWSGTMVSPQWLVVSHYLFFSEEWELHLEWHIMVAPDVWVRIDLRHRPNEIKPSAAFEISSVSINAEPIPVEVPAEIWR